jgi:maleamate amidohydrolase
MTDTKTIDGLLDFYDRRGYAYRIGPGSRPAVVVIDFSRAFTEGTGPFPGGDFGTQIAAARRLLDAARAHDAPVYFTTIAYDDPGRDAGFWFVKVPWLGHCKTGSPLIDIDPRLARRASEPVVVKPYPSAFFRTDLEQRLRHEGVDTVVIAGCTTSVCVRATALDAMQRGFRPIVAAEAVGDFDPALHAVHLKDLESRYADVTSVDDIVRMLASLQARGAAS